MEVPIILATDTTENWNRSDTALGAGELAIELAGVRADGSPVKHLLVGDGKPTGPNVARLRATPEIIAGLPQALQNLAANTATEGGAWRQAVAAEASTRENADRALQESINSQVAGEREARKAAAQSEAASRESADQALQESIDSQVAGEREAWQAAAQAETEERERAVQALDDAKISKAVAGDKGTFVQSVGVKEVTSNGFIAAHKNVDVESGAVTETWFELPQASEEESGIMPAESFKQIADNTRRIMSLEGRGLIFPVELASENPSQSELQAAFEAASGMIGAPPDQATLRDKTFDKTYIFFATLAEWVDMGGTTIAPFSNDNHGLIRGDNEDGKVFAENDGTGSVVGWTELKTRTANNETNIEQALSGLEGLIPDGGLPVSRGGTGATAAAAARTNLGAAPIVSPTFTGVPNVPIANAAVAAAANPTDAQSRRVATVGQIAATRNAINGEITTDVWRWITFNDFTRDPSIRRGPFNNAPNEGRFYVPGDIVISVRCHDPVNSPQLRTGFLFLCVEQTARPPLVVASANGSNNHHDWTWESNMEAFEVINVTRRSLPIILLSLVPRLRSLLGPNVINVVYNMAHFAGIRRQYGAGLGISPTGRDFTRKQHAAYTVQLRHIDSFGIVSFSANTMTRKMHVVGAMGGNFTLPAQNYRFFGERSIDSFGGTLPVIPLIASFEAAVPIVTADDHTPNVFHFPGVGRNIFRDFLHGIRDSNPGTPPDDLTVITFTDSEEREKKAPLTRQMKKAKVPIINAGLRFQRDKDLYKGWRNFLKCKYLCEVLPTVTTKYVLVLDADDVAVQTFDGILDNFRKYNLPVLFGATLARFPDEEIDTVENRESLGPFNYLNAGTCIGETKKVLEFYLLCCKVEPEDVLLNRGEQHTVRQVFNNCQSWVGFDYRSRVFQLVGTRFEKWTNITREDNRFIVKVESSG